MEVRAIAVRIADRLEQFNGQTYFLMDSSAVEYIDKNGNSQSVKDILDNTSTDRGGSSEKQIKDWVSGSSYLEGDYIYHEGEIYRCLASNNDVDFDEANWKQLTYGIDELSKEDVERLLGLTEEEIEAMADLISDTEVRIDKTYSSSKIYTDIQQCLEDSKTFTSLELGKISGASYKVVSSTSEMTSESIIYLLANGNTYDMYIVKENGATTKIGDMNIDLSNYYTKTEINNDFLKKVDADGKYATITTVDGKVDTLSNRIQPSAVIFKKENTSYSTLRELILNHEFFKSSTAEEFIFGAEGFDDLPVTNWGFSIRLYTRAGNKYIIAYKMLSNDLFYTRSMDYDGTWLSDWKRVCTTSVADVPKTDITIDTSKFTKKTDSSYISYCVVNGMCTIQVDGIGLVNTGSVAVSTGLPKPLLGKARNILQVEASATVPTKPVYIQVVNGNLAIYSDSNNGCFWGDITYPVAK